MRTQPVAVELEGADGAPEIPSCDSISTAASVVPALSSRAKAAAPQLAGWLVGPLSLVTHHPVLLTALDAGRLKRGTDRLFVKDVARVGSSEGGSLIDQETKQHKLLLGLINSIRVVRVLCVLCDGESIRRVSLIDDNASSFLLGRVLSFSETKID